MIIERLYGITVITSNFVFHKSFSTSFQAVINHSKKLEDNNKISMNLFTIELVMKNWSTPEQWLNLPMSLKVANNHKLMGID